MRRFLPISLGVLLLLSAYSLVAAEWATEKVPLPDLLKPGAIAFDDEQMYVTEQATVYIYGRKDFKLRKKFGQRGEGPQEFKIMDGGEVSLAVKPDLLEISSMKKVSFFKKDGTFINEIILNDVGFGYMAGDRFVIFRAIITGDIHYFVYDLFNSKLEKIKEIWRMESTVHVGKKFKFFDQTDKLIVYGNNIFVSGGRGLDIDVLNFNGEKVLSIKHDYEKIKVTEKHREAIRNWFRNDPGLKIGYRITEPWFWYPEYFPGMREFTVADDYIYVRTYANCGENRDKSEFVIFTINGKFVKKVTLPVFEKNINDTYPYNFYGGKLYQLVDNVDTEEWDLHITPIPGIMISDKSAN